MTDRITLSPEHRAALTATDAVTTVFGEIHARFQDQLHDGGINDMWTAAVALAQPEPLPVVTHNRSDFERMCHGIRAAPSAAAEDAV